MPTVFSGSDVRRAYHGMLGTVQRLESVPGLKDAAADVLDGSEVLFSMGDFLTVLPDGTLFPEPAKSVYGTLLRAIPFALLTPLDRQVLRRNASVLAGAAGTNELDRIVLMSMFLVTADLLRFPLEDVRVRVRQSLLEEAPLAVLDALARPLSEGVKNEPSALSVLANALDLARLPLAELLQEAGDYDEAPASFVIGCCWRSVCFPEEAEQAGAALPGHLRQRVETMERRTVATPPDFSEPAGRRS